jgi:hypothetical protein
MIGGSDIVLTGARPKEPRFVLECFRSVWPDGVFHDADASNLRSLREVTPTTKTDAREFFVYENAASFDSWVAEGATAENGSRMVHVIVEPKRVTFVVDRADSALGQLVREIVDALTVKRMYDLTHE